MKIVDERNKTNGRRFDSLPIGEFFHEVSDDGEDASLYIKLSNDFLPDFSPTNKGNAWSVSYSHYCFFNEDDMVYKVNVKITLTD